MEYTSLTPVSKIQINQPSERPLDRPTLVRPQRTSTVLINEGGGGGNNCAVNSNSAPVQVVDPFLMMQRQMSTPTMMDPNMMLQLQVNINRIGSLTFYFFRPKCHSKVLKCEKKYIYLIHNHFCLLFVK